MSSPGPYVNAEISMGGLPSYLTKSGVGGLRSADPEALREPLSWIDAFDKISVRHQVTDCGGSILTYQAENELLNESGDRRAFMRAVVTKIKGDGIAFPGVPRPAEMLAWITAPLIGAALGFTCSNGRGQIQHMETRFRARTATSPMFIAGGQVVPTLRGGQLQN